ncbi:hypothetical protein CYMTET_24841 [Cymbomonas tetramitiformis]|uniref:Uncharacterized protein n=1 Tax=Cymbomonas tetramitiformis TaxID=36881 RepID=A0AAE0FV20_9CHLO|nr:hypothetical protein CYMTET_24841 [Cymbomonas tetramitiformis]
MTALEAVAEYMATVYEDTRRVTVGPFREEPKTAISYLGHLTSAIRHLHNLPEGTHVLRCGQTQLRWYADKVAEFHLTFEKSEYAITALATSLVHLPLHYCVPLGSDDFQVTDVCIRG